jgi:transcriptional regulator GlxA family with amidase domain
MCRRLAKIADWEELAKQANFQPAVMAALCPVSLRQMERFFVERFNQAPLRWVRQLRCRLARQLIAEGWSSKAVTAELGFASGSHLAREFRHFYGDSPQAFAPSFGSNRASATLSFIPTPRSNHAPRGTRRSDVVFMP